MSIAKKDKGGDESEGESKKWDEADMIWKTKFGSMIWETKIGNMIWENSLLEVKDMSGAELKAHCEVV